MVNIRSKTFQQLLTRRVRLRQTLRSIEASSRLARSAVRIGRNSTRQPAARHRLPQWRFSTAESALAVVVAGFGDPGAPDIAKRTAAGVDAFGYNALANQKFGSRSLHAEHGRRQNPD